MSEQIDHNHTMNIVCPYCGCEDDDSYEVEPGEEELGLQTCGNCEKEFYAHRNISITYTTREATYGTCARCGETDVVIEDFNSSVGSYKGLCPDCGYERQKELIRAYRKELDRQLGRSTQ